MSGAPVSWQASLVDMARRLGRQGSRSAGLAPATRRAYLKDARMLAGWLSEHGVAGPEDVTPTALDAAMRGLGWSPSTRARGLSAAREWLDPHHPPGRGPAELLERPRVSPPPVPRLSQAEAAAVVDLPLSGKEGELARALSERDRAILELLYGSGLRRQEVCDLRLGGLDFEHETARVLGKGNRARTVPLTEPAVAALRRWLASGRPRLAREAPPTDLVFLSRSGRALDGSAVYRMVSRRLREIGRGGGPHLLRHAAGTHMLEGHGDGGAHLRVVQQVLGHASLATTQRYTGVTTRAMQQQLRRGLPR